MRSASYSGLKSVLKTGGNKALKQIVGNLLDAIIWPLMSNPMPYWKDMSRRIGQTIGPPDGGGIEHDVPFWTIIYRGCISARFLPLDKRITFGNDIHSGQVQRG